MSRVAVFFAEGFEEVEALTVVDVCRRGGLAVDMVSVMGSLEVAGSHGIVIKADKVFEQADLNGYDALVLPGGMPGTKNLETHEGLMGQIDAFYGQGKYVAAICAAPSVLGHRGILKGRRACCYPGFEGHLEGASVTTEPVEVSGHVITSRGMGTAIEFGLAILSVFCGKEKAEELAGTIVYH